MRPRKCTAFSHRCRFRSNMVKGKSWMTAVQPIETFLPHFNVFSITIFGAIGTPLSKPLFHVCDSTNKDDFKRFIKELKVCVRSELWGKKFKPVLLLDNHSAHTSAATKTVLETNFEPMFQPTYSCKFNSIECKSRVMHFR